MCGRENSSLFHAIHHITHTGLYYCMATNSMGETKSREARMTVHETQPVQTGPQVPPATRQQQQQQRQIPTDHIYFDEEADYIVMHCVSPTRVTWTHNGQPLSSSTAEHIDIFDNGTLVIREPNEQDEGNYQCTTTSSTVANYELNGKRECARNDANFRNNTVCLPHSNPLSHPCVSLSLLCVLRGHKLFV